METGTTDKEPRINIEDKDKEKPTSFSKLQNTTVTTATKRGTSPLINHKGSKRSDQGEFTDSEGETQTTKNRKKTESTIKMNVEKLTNMMIEQGEATKLMIATYDQRTKETISLLLQPLHNQIQHLTNEIIQLKTTIAQQNIQTNLPTNNQQIQKEANNWTTNIELRKQKTQIENLNLNNTQHLNQNPQNHKTTNPAYQLARRCVGFSPINLNLNQPYTTNPDQLKKNSEEFQEVGAKHIKEFMNKEMNMNSKTTNSLRIKNIFYPPGGALTEKLYIEFQHEDEAKEVKKHVKNLTKSENYEPQVCDYIPRSLMNRHQAVKLRAYTLRNESEEPLQTKIWINEDIELRVRKKGDPTPWAKIPKEELLNLPDQTPKNTRSTNYNPLTENTPQTPRIHEQNHASSL